MSNVRGLSNRLESFNQSASELMTSIESEMEKLDEKIKEVQDQEFLAYKLSSVAKLLEVSYPTVYRLIEDGKLPSINLTGTTRRVYRKDLLEFLEKKRSEKKGGAAS